MHFKKGKQSLKKFFLRDLILQGFSPGVGVIPLKSIKIEEIPKIKTYLVFSTTRKGYGGVPGEGSKKFRYQQGFQHRHF